MITYKKLLKSLSCGAIPVVALLAAAKAVGADRAVMGPLLYNADVAQDWFVKDCSSPHAGWQVAAQAEAWDSGGHWEGQGVSYQNGWTASAYYWPEPGYVMQNHRASLMAFSGSVWYTYGTANNLSGCWASDLNHGTCTTSYTQTLNSKVSSDITTGYGTCTNRSWESVSIGYWEPYP